MVTVLNPTHYLTGAQAEPARASRRVRFWLWCPKGMPVLLPCSAVVVVGFALKRTVLAQSQRLRVVKVCSVPYSR